jgi:hypothetical protein
MSEHSTFELVDDSALTSSGFQLRVNVAIHTSARPDEVTVTPGCATFGEFQAAVRHLINELEAILTAGESRFAEGPFGPKPLFDGDK